MMEWRSIEPDVDRTLLKSQRKHNAARIAAVFGIPPEALGQPGKDPHMNAKADRAFLDRLFETYRT